MRIHPTPGTLRHWADHLLPERDVWFWDDREPDVDLAGCIVLTRADYLDHPTFQGIAYVNAYLHWQMPPEVTQVIVSGPAWIASLAPADRYRVLDAQATLQRGLVFPRSHFDELPKGLDAYVIADNIVLSHAVWSLIPDDARQTALLREQARWDDVDGFAVPDNVPAHIRAIANAFGDVEGANCMSTTAFATTGDEALRDLWMAQPVFQEIIGQNGYHPAAETSPVAGDVVTFETGGDIIHAAYCVGPDRFLNKNGQSRFNPIRVVDWATLLTDWPATTRVIHRRQTANHGDPPCT